MPYDIRYLVSGEILACWMLKVLLGVYFSKNAGGPDGPAIDNHTLDMALVLDVLYKQRWIENCGLYIKCVPGSEIKSSLSFEVMPLGGMKTVYGARIKIYGLEFYLLLDDLYSSVLIPDTGCILRPSNITCEAGLRKHIIALTWSDVNPASVRGVTVSRP